MIAVKVGGALAVAVVAALVGCSASAPAEPGTNEDAITATATEVETSAGRDGVDRQICGPDRTNFCPAGFTCIGVTDTKTGHCFKDCSADTDCPAGQTCRNFDNSGPREPEYAGHCEVAQPAAGAAASTSVAAAVVRAATVALWFAGPKPISDDVKPYVATRGASPAPVGPTAGGEETLDQR